MKTTDPKVPTGIFVAILCVAMVILAPLFDLVMNGGTISARNGWGIVVAVIAIYLLQTK